MYCDEITGQLSDIYYTYGCNEGNVIVLDMEVYGPSGAPEPKVKEYANWYNLPMPVVSTVGGAKRVDTATLNGIKEIPTVKLIAPDKTVLSLVTWSQAGQIKTTLVQKQVPTKVCEHIPVITDTIQGSGNITTSGTWYAEIDGENLGSKVVKQPTLTGSEMSATLFVAKYDYTGNKWPYGKVALPCGNTAVADKRYIKITYKVNDDILVELPMAQTDSVGENYGKRLPAATDWTTAVLDLQTFAQPPWTAKATPLDYTKVNELVFVTPLGHGKNVDFSFREIATYKKGVNSIIPSKFTSGTGVRSVKLTRTVLHVACDKPLPMTASIFTANGRKVMQVSKTPGQNGAVTTPVRLSEGIYIVKISSVKSLTHVMRLAIGK